jgi:hypothetical protein
MPCLVHIDHATPKVAFGLRCDRRPLFPRRWQLSHGGSSLMAQTETTTLVLISSHQIFKVLQTVISVYSAKLKKTPARGKWMWNIFKYWNLLYLNSQSNNFNIGDTIKE